MAINLNKGGEESAKPTEEKKKLNLSKKGETENVKIDLSKEKVDPLPNSSIPEIQEKKKSPIFSVVIVVIGLAIGAYWFLSQNGESDNTSEKNDTEAVTNAVVAEEVVEVAPQTENEAGAATVGTPDASSDVAPSSNQGNTTTSSSSNATATKATPVTSELSKPASTSTTGVLQGSLEEKAKQVLAGAYGNGAERKRNLGEEYAEIQAKVNSLVGSSNQ